MGLSWNLNIRKSINLFVGGGEGKNSLKDVYLKVLNVVIVPVEVKCM